jgi:hypothetical protein
MTTLLKISSALFGYDYKTVLHQPTSSRQKIVTMGTLLFIPLILWTVSGFYLSRFMLGTGLGVSIGVAIVLGLIIFIVDRSFVATPKSQKGYLMPGLRLCFALISTVLGSLAIDLMLFKGDLEEFRQSEEKRLRQEEILKYKDIHGLELARLDEALEKAEKRYGQLSEAFFKEMDGSGGTGKYGKGKVAEAKEAEKIKAGEELEKLKIQRQTTLDSLDKRALIYSEEKIQKRGDALMSQVKDLHDFILKDKFTLGFYLFFFGFVFLLESYFILYKISASETLYEQFLVAEEEYGQQRLAFYKEQKGRMLKEKGLLGGDYDKVIQLTSSGRRKII